MLLWYLHSSNRKLLIISVLTGTNRIKNVKVLICRLPQLQHEDTHMYSFWAVGYSPEATSSHSQSYHERFDQYLLRIWTMRLYTLSRLVNEFFITFGKVDLRPTVSLPGSPTRCDMLQDVRLFHQLA